MAASRSDHHRIQAEAYNKVLLISCDYGFFSDSSDHEERQLTGAEAMAVGVTPILVISEKKSKMILADCAAKELKTNFQLGRQPSGFWDWVILK